MCSSGAVHCLQVERLQAAHTSAEGQEQQRLLQGLTAAEQLLADLRLGISAADLQLAAAEAESQHAWETAEAAASEASRLEGVLRQAESHQVAARELQQADGSISVAQQVSEQPPPARHVARAVHVAQNEQAVTTKQTGCHSTCAFCLLGAGAGHVPASLLCCPCAAGARAKPDVGAYGVQQLLKSPGQIDMLQALVQAQAQHAAVQRQLAELQAEQGSRQAVARHQLQRQQRLQSEVATQEGLASAKQAGAAAAAQAQMAADQEAAQAGLAGPV